MSTKRLIRRTAMARCRLTMLTPTRAPNITAKNEEQATLFVAWPISICHAVGQFSFS